MGAFRRSRPFGVDNIFNSEVGESMTIYEMINQTFTGILGVDWCSLLLPAILFFIIIMCLKR